MSLKEGLLSLSILIALLCVPAAVAAAGGGGPDEPYYIKVVLDEPKGYLELNIETVDALDPLDTGNTSVALQSTETGDLKAIECPLLGSITREFSPASGPYKGTNVTVTENKTVDGSTFPREYRVYTTPTIPSFTVNVPGRWGNVLLIKCPENLDIDASFTELFNTTNKEGYLFTEDGILHVRIKGTNPAGFGNPFGLPADQNSLSNTLNENRVDLSNFNFRHDALNADELHYIPQPKAGEYLLTAVEYDSASETMHVLAAMPVLILNGDTPVTWSGDTPHSQDEDVNISFGEGANVDKIAYALVKNDTTYGLQVKINTIELAKQPVPTSAVDVISILKSIAERGLLAEYILTCDTDTPNVIYNKDSCLAIVEGYGCSGANDAPSVGIAAETLATLNPGTYYLYALGMQGQNVTAVDQTEVTIVAPAPVAPVAGFSTNVTEGVAPLTVAFTDESTGATSWAWDFGDGNTSADQNPVHTYETADTYTVTLTVMNEAGSNSTTQTITVTEAPVTPAPVASFTTNVTEGVAPLTVAFTDESTGATSWAWDFGDGNTSTEQNPVHTYETADTYTVTLTVMNEAGSNSTTQTITVTEAPVTPTPTQISRRSSGGGGGGSSTSVGAANNLQAGDRVALSMDRTAISAVAFTAQNQIKDVMVTMAKGSLPRDAMPPTGTVYQYVEATLYRAAEDDLSNIWFRFAVPTDWLAMQGCTADEVGLFRFTDDGWQEVPVEVLGEENGNALFAASPEGFGLFAIAMTEKVPGVDEPTPEPTETETTPTADVTTPPADKPTTEPTPTPGFGALVALAGLGAGAVLILRRE